MRIKIEPSPDTNDHEVILLGNDDNLVDRFQKGMMGMDPDEILVRPTPLAAGKTPHVCTIGRCDCGVVGCGDVQVRVEGNADFVTWTDVHGSRSPIRFDSTAYHLEVERALEDHTWESPERTAERLIRTRVDSRKLARSGLRFDWASGRAKEGFMTLSLTSKSGPHQILTRIPWVIDSSPASISKTALALLARDPSSWPDVEWLPQGPDHTPPSIAGPGWRRWQF